MKTTDEMKTSDPLMMIASDLSYLVLDVRSIQPKLHKRMTAKVKRKQEAYILNATKEIFGGFENGNA